MDNVSQLRQSELQVKQRDLASRWGNEHIVYWSDLLQDWACVLKNARRWPDQDGDGVHAGRPSPWHHSHSGNHPAGAQGEGERPGQLSVTDMLSPVIVWGIEQSQPS